MGWGGNGPVEATKELWVGVNRNVLVINRGDECECIDLSKLIVGGLESWLSG